MTFLYCVFLCHITLYSVAVSLFLNNVTLTGGGREARCVGRVRPEQTETQISQPRTEKARAGDELSSPSSRAVSSRRDRAQKSRHSQINTCVNGVMGKSSKSMRGGKALKGEPVGSTKAWSDLMTPEKEDLGCLRNSPAARTHEPAVGNPGSPHGSRKGNMGVTRQNHIGFYSGF